MAASFLLQKTDKTQETTEEAKREILSDDFAMIVARNKIAGG